ncbi:hypothetical protein [endosymbiont of unidentified scaly snail isolate Monju]|uniref:hypothetical protein n=1 Tax=endosymbiont of unidentified scaly snail isolate Monju TaxID=1248727 RepID=UPI0003891D63|nr:hypothetical protein [endosymbiont of unidentified scaly snail isolate Monju]BAN69240.1 conserved hypothetical protein [endosymbiont of unidentified scaly snail isolate Monju]
MATLPVTKTPTESIPLVQKIVSILWPSFLTAAGATILFFAVFDPRTLAELHQITGLSRLAGYTLGFFGFWLLTSISSALTCYFRRPCHEQAPTSTEGNDVEQ